MTRPVVHLELHTGDLPGAREFYAGLLGWRSERIVVPSGSYTALDVGGRLDGGIVECAARRPLWLPYVEVADIGAATERARALGASVTLEPREGPAGWRGVVAAAPAGEIALWQPKR
jgi:predicted enzyme related to lactoylglutathione lyase